MQAAETDQPSSSEQHNDKVDNTINEDDDYQYYLLDSCHSTTTHAKGNTVLDTRSGHQILLPNLTRAPTFTQNLLSVAELTTTNKCSVVFTSDGGYIVRGKLKPPRSGTLAQFQRKRSRCAIPHRPVPNIQRFASYVQQPKCGRQTEMSQYLKKTKPRQSTKETPASCLNVSPPAPVLSKAQPSRYEKKEAITHTVRYLSHLPPVPQKMKKQLTEAYNWHIRLNHVSLDSSRKMATIDHDVHLPQTLKGKPVPMKCIACFTCHMTRAPHQHKVPAAPPVHTISTDIGGPLPKTAAGYKYYLAVTEHTTRFRIIYLISSKMEAVTSLRKAIANLTRHFGKPPARVRPGNANEYLPKALLEETEKQCM